MTGVALIAACGDNGGNGPANTAPTADFTYECTNLTCAFTDHSTDDDGTIASRDWNFGDGSAHATAVNPNHVYAGTGTYNVTLAATDNDGDSDTSPSQPVTVTAASATVQASFDVACAGLTCTLTNTSTATGVTTTYAWTFGDGQSSNAQNPAPVVYDASAPTTFTIVLGVTSDGILSQATKQVRISPPATLTCGSVDCALHLDQAATVVVTLKSHSCLIHNNTFVITAPEPVDTLFTDGCFAAVDPDPASSFTLNNGDAYAAGTDLSAEVLTGVAGAENPQLRVTGTFAAGWTLEFDDGFVGPNEPDFNDLIITVKATPAP